MSEPVARINLFRSAVVAKIKETMPDLRECEAQFGRFNLDELERGNLRLPAVRFAVIKAGLPREPGGGVEARLSCAAFILAEGRDRHDEAWAMAEAIATLLHSSQMWGLTKLGAPSSIEMQPVVQVESNRRGVAVMAVEWVQELRALGDNIFDVEGVLLTELYINGEQVDLPAPPDDEEAGGDGGGDDG